MFGGFGGLDLNDAWTVPVDGSSGWTPMTPSGTPPAARMKATAVYDPVGDRVILFGGYKSGGTTTRFNDVWALTLDGTPAWQDMTPSGTVPRHRYSHAAVFDPVDERMIVFGGRTNYVSGSHTVPLGLDDTWAQSFTGAGGWTELAVGETHPSAREQAVAIYDPIRRRMVLFGGGPADVLWSLDLAGVPHWTQLAPPGDVPPSLVGPRAMYDPVRDRMVVYGVPTGSPTGSLRQLSLAGPPVWTLLASGISAVCPQECRRRIRSGQRPHDPVRRCGTWRHMVLHVGGAARNRCHGRARRRRHTGDVS